jgi:hypothetical protein
MTTIPVLVQFQAELHEAVPHGRGDYSGRGYSYKSSSRCYASALHRLLSYTLLGLTGVWHQQFLPSDDLELVIGLAVFPLVFVSHGGSLL